MITEYTFSSIFGSNIKQAIFFNTWIIDKVLMFMIEINELFTYGTINAGKIYTIRGNPNDPNYF